MASDDLMKAAVLDSSNAAFRLAEVTRPKAEAGQLLVRIKASGVNPLDTKIQAGQAPHARAVPSRHPRRRSCRHRRGRGAGVTGFRPGDEVYGMAGGVAGLQGSLAEFAAVDARLMAPKPANLSLREAAALPLIFITAWEGLVDRAQIQAGQTLLVQGGAGGVGHIAVQLGAAFGAEVFATALSVQPGSSSAGSGRRRSTIAP